MVVEGVGNYCPLTQSWASRACVPRRLLFASIGVPLRGCSSAFPLSRLLGVLLRSLWPIGCFVFCCFPPAPALTCVGFGVCLPPSLVACSCFVFAGFACELVAHCAGGWAWLAGPCVPPALGAGSVLPPTHGVGCFPPWSGTLRHDVVCLLI